MTSSVNSRVDAVYVLSVKTYTGRIRSVQNEMARHGIEFRFMFDHDAADLSDADIDAVFAPSNMRRGHQSLVMKNIRVWQEAVTQGYRRVLIFEDDVLLSPGFAAGFNEAMRAADELPPGWEIFLGGLDARAPFSYFRNKGPLVPLPVPTTEACVHDLEAMRRRLAWLARNKVTQPVDHLMNRIDREMGTAQYWLRHPVVEQGSLNGLFDSELDGARQKQSRWHTQAHYRWNRFKRRDVREWLAKWC